MSSAETTTLSTFYRRPLPEGLVPFSSDEGRRLFREALEQGDMEGYFAMAEQFHTQADPAFCGLGSLVVVLNALEIDPGRLWKGPWRWFSEELLDCCAPLDAVREKGLTMDELACLGRCNGAEVDIVRALDADVSAFRAALHEVVRSPRAPVMVAGYSRAKLDQTGDGHFSPVAGYHAERDLVLLLDVARFKYPPHWVPLARLFEAMQTRDPATGRSRGWLTFRARATPKTILYSLKAHATVRELLLVAQTNVRSRLAAPNIATAEDALIAFARAVGPIAELVDIRIHEADEATRHARAVLGSLRATAVHRTIANDAPSQERIGSYDVAAALALAVPDATWELLAAQVRHDVRALLDAARAERQIHEEISILREQIAALLQLSACRAT